MRHSSIVLTMDRYTHLSAEDERTAIGLLPSFAAGDDAQRATGTGGSACRVLAPGLSDDGQPCPTMAIEPPTDDTENAFLERHSSSVEQVSGLCTRSG